MLNFFRKVHHYLFSNVRHKYQLLIVDENLQTKLAFYLSRLNLIAVIGTTAIVLIVGTLYLVVGTPLREFIPGYMRQDIVDLAYENQIKIDSLEKCLTAQSRYIQAMDMAIAGRIPMAAVDKTKDTIRGYAHIAYERSEDDKALRELVENGDKYDLQPTKIGTTASTAAKPTAVPASTTTQKSTEDARMPTVSSLTTSKPVSSVLYYVPLHGKIVTNFDASKKHYGIDIAGNNNDMIKSIGEGTVVNVEWSPTTAYAITVQHSNNMLSMYKNNSAILKRVGDPVKTGEPIALIGESLEQYKGLMLHFELWYQGSPVNPKNFIAF